ncbi:hypothetical protein ACGF7W_34645 [Streptomyces sp. NPDC048219]|uniref:hypothetical protein n=1 Tax=Streptomyces sp. NPDC048219 TaxID=3365517 RepID=UPI0037110105
MPDLAGDLANAEDELARLRGIVANTTAWIHDDAYDIAARRALAQRLKLPEPSPRTRSTDGAPDRHRPVGDHSPGPNAGRSTLSATED